VESEVLGDSGDDLDAPIVFISDASAEAERLTLALRSRGYVVVDVPLALLAGRVAIQRPALVLCDADAEGALQALERVHEASAPEQIPVVLLGQGGETIGDVGPAREASPPKAAGGAVAQASLGGPKPPGNVEAGLVGAVFTRPVNVQDLLGTIERLIGTGRSSRAPSLAPSARGGGKIATSSRPPARVSAVPSARVDRSPWGENAPAGGPALPLPPDLGGEPTAPREVSDAPTVELSLDVRTWLADAERRLEENRPPPVSSREDLGPELDVEGPLPPDVLAALEEPLDDEDSYEEGQTPEPARDGTNPLTASRAVKGRTHIGGGHTSLGTDGTGTPESEPSVGSARGRTTSTGIGTNPDRAPPSVAAENVLDPRLARQTASTPKPPKPGPNEVGTDGPASLRGTVPPPTVAESPLSDPRAFGTRENEQAAKSRTGVVQIPLSPEEPLRGRAPLNFDSDMPERDLTSTTPPVRRRDDGSEPPPSERRSDRPSSPRPTTPPTHREGERGPQARTEPPGERPSEPPQRGATRGDPRDALPPSAPVVATLDIPTALRAGDAIVALAKAIGSRFTGALAFEVDEGIRRVVLREGDLVTVASGVHGESLVAFLVARGDLPAEVARQGHKLPAFGRRAGAALIAHGHLAQDQLWPVLRAHSEWLVGRILGIDRGNASVEDVGRLHDEPAVFGGATGAEVLVEVTRRTVPPEDAVDRLGGPNAGLASGPSKNLLGECALSALETERVQLTDGIAVRELLEASPDPSFASALYALVALGVLRTEGLKARVEPGAKPARDDLDEEALRARILARKALIDEGDYFAVLGVTRDATGYDIRRAYTNLRREFEPSRSLTSFTADLGDTVDEIIDVLEEAYQILGDQRRRERYRRAIEASP
jgi:hypothetical protein